MSNKLKRSKADRIIAGVCGGIGEYFNIDPIIIRIIWVVFTLMPGTPGLLAYIICMFVIPEDDGVIYHNNNSSNINTSSTSIFIGIALVVIGGLMLLRIIFPKFYNIFNIFRYWPILLIIAGIYIIYNQRKR